MKANGYRTFIRLAKVLIGIISDVMNKIQVKNKTTKNGASEDDFKELSYWVLCFDHMTVINGFLIEMQNHGVEGKLLPEQPDLRCDSQMESLSLRIATQDCSVMYGRGRGFHYCDPDLIRFTGAITLGLVMYADLHELSFTRMLESRVGLKYMYDSEYQAARISEAIREMPVEFCQAFYGMSESDLLGRPLRAKMGSIKTSHLIKINPEPMKARLEDGTMLDVPIPSCYIGVKPIHARLISPYRTVDMMGDCMSCIRRCQCEVQPKSRAIFFHLHGGGFIAQTSKSHETYLRKWSRDNGVPILSVDYSLAPEAPYPRALEEIFYAYCWMQRNLDVLGTTGEFVLIGGDSAGGNFSAGITIKCLTLGLRAPDAMLLMYPSLLCQMYPSPSRMVCLFDPMVMFPFLLRCLNAYSDPDYKKTCPRTFVQELDYCGVNYDPLLSPLFAPKEILKRFPPCHLISTDIDPCLDEVITFSNHLVEAGTAKVTLNVINGLPHGFLSLNSVSAESQQAVDFISAKIGNIIG